MRGFQALSANEFKPMTEPVGDMISQYLDEYIVGLYFNLLQYGSGFVF